DTMYKNKSAGEFILKFSDDSSLFNKNNNTILEEISKSIPKILEYTQVSFNYSIEIAAIDVSKANKKGIKKYNINVKINPGKPSGDIQYKTFDITGFLLPDESNISIIISENDGLHEHSISQNNIQAGTDKTFSAAFTFTDSLPLANPKVTLGKIQFYYNDSSLVKFREKTQYINNYYSSEFFIASLQEKLDGINLSFADLIKIYDIKLKEIEKELAVITGMNYIETLGLYSNDPVGFINKYSTLNVKIKDMRNKINGMLSTLDKVYYDKGVEYFSKNDTANALIYFEKSTISNPFYSPAFLQLARIYFYKNDLYSSDQKLINITTKLNPDQSTLKQVIQLADSLNARFIENGEACIAAENYHEALKILNEAKIFCNTVKVITCSETLLKDIAKAKYGIYSSFITVSKKAVDAGKLDIADIYIVKAKDYQIENSTDIISSEEADNLLSILVNGLTENGISLNILQLFDSALVVLQKASDLCKKYSINSCSDRLLPAITISKQGIYKSLIKKAEEYIKTNEPAKAEEIIAEAKKYQQENSAEITVAIATDSLSGKMKEKFYQKYISDGISYLKIHEGINALRCFNMAKDIERKHLITPDKTLDSLINASANPYVRDYIEKGLVNVWGNEPGKAQSISDTVKFLLQKYGLAQDSALQASLTNLENNISALYCKQAGEKYNEYYRNAYQKISVLNYTEAVNYFQKCISTVNSNSACDINNVNALTGFSKYQNAAKYQKLISLSDSAARSGSYDAAIEKYYEAENFSSSVNLTEFGLSHTAFDNFIVLQDKNYLLKASEYFHKKNNTAKTFYCLDILRKHNFSDSSITAFQNKIAFDLCKADYLTYPEQKPTELIKKYAVDDTWYLPFKKMYIAYWKELKKKK
ncbi:MAG: hypothetical protein V1904_00665, partial [Bacteroidota bacterium]